MNKKLDIQRMYNLTSDIYNLRYRLIQYAKYKQMLDDIDIYGRILDIGCGTGLLLEYLKDRDIDAELIGVDISMNMLKQCSGYMVLMADAEHLPFSNKSFDFVFSFTMLQNLPTKNINFFSEVNRVLKPQSTFVLTTLRKKYNENIQFKLCKYFDIYRIVDCYEDIGFVCRPK